VDPKAERKPQSLPAAAPWLLLIALAGPLFFLGLGSVGLFDPDEPYYALPALEMLRSGSWLMPLFHGQPWFDKPILFYWLVLAGYKTVGVSELAVRLASAGSALVGVLAVYGLGRRSAFGPRAALVGALVLATTLEYGMLARAGVTDMTLTAAFSVGMLCAAEALGSGRRRAAFLAGLAFGAAALVKGPVAPLLAVLALGAYGLAARRADVVRPRFVAPLATGFALAALPWYGWVARAHPDLLLGTFLDVGNLGRFTAPEHVQSSWFYAKVLLAGFLPWSAALPFALPLALRRSSRAAERGAGALPGPLFALCWFGAVLLLFSVAASKLISYILPAFPAAALLVGAFWSEAFDRAAPRRRSGVAAAFVGAAIVAALAAAPHLLALPERSRPLVAPASLGLAVLAAGALASLLALRRRSLGGFLAPQLAAAVVAMLVAVFVVLPRAETATSQRPVARELAARGLAGELQGSYAVRQSFSLDFYLGHEVPRLFDLAQLERAVRAAPRGVWILNDRFSADLRACDRIRVQPLFSIAERTVARLSPVEGRETRR